ncbi:VOC family protein [Bailinhaonella thermotolerans]|uniref:VOC family protein n=1 Tax=Bailinhaonella thermotolerans TaxID=1070861 RepID=UPI00192A4EAD|nr:VOC family protein [Bailinhaonella thermotolerans]
MHRSRVGSVVIDCDDLTVGKTFWAGVLGVPTPDDDGQWAMIPGVIGDGVRLLLQKVPEPHTCKARVHLDIETDDVEAETRRLEKLGATRVGPFEDQGWVLADPLGNEFCVLRAGGTANWPERAVTWEELPSDE